MCSTEASKVAIGSITAALLVPENMEKYDVE
jgi:hypothetical protein